jgi:hypothetical protein
MPRRLRIEFEGAIYHVMTRGNTRQRIVHDDDDRTRLLGDLERTVLRLGWELLAFVVMGNHLHLLAQDAPAESGQGDAGLPLRTLLTAWHGEWGGNDAARAYRRYVEAGVTAPPRSPFRESFGGWVLGSSGFVERLRTLAEPVSLEPPSREARQLAALDPGAVLAAVTDYYALDDSALRRRHDHHIARAMAAWLLRDTRKRHSESWPALLASRVATVCRAWYAGWRRD